MFQEERIKIITELLKKNGFVTVKFLTDELHYSSATINRDLNLMQKKKLIKRSYGGVELVKQRGVPLMFRYNKMRPEKNKIAKRAAQLIMDGDTIFIDGTTTSQYLGKYITEKKNLTVITNNMALAQFLSENGVRVVVLGGTIVESPHMIADTETVLMAEKYHADKFFFSVGTLSENGEIGISDMYYLLDKAMVKNSQKTVLLADHEKIKPAPKHIWGTLKDVDMIISDYEFTDEVKQIYPDTEFILVE